MAHGGPDLDRLSRRHLRLGFWLLGVFALAGAALEAMHGFKSDWYLAVGNETRRLLWRLAHAHGAFLSLVHVAFGLAVTRAHGGGPRLASPCLIGSSIAIPAGFFLGGAVTYAGDPGVGIVLLPLGVLLLLIAVFATAVALREGPRAG